MFITANYGRGRNFKNNIHLYDKTSEMSKSKAMIKGNSIKQL